MLTYIPIRRLLIAALVGLIVTSSVLPAGATDDAFKKSRELRRSATKACSEVNKYVSQLDETERALSLVNGAGSGNLRKRYESFSKATAKLEKAQARATSEIDRMRTTSAEYFSAWDKSNAQISDAELREASARRRSRVLERHRALADDLSKIGLALGPFMSNLRDLRSFLGNDLLPENVVKAQDMIERSKTDAEALKERIANVQITLKQFLTETSE